MHTLFKLETRRTRNTTKRRIQANPFGNTPYTSCVLLSEHSGDGGVDDDVATGSSIYTARTEWFCERRPHEFVERTVHGTNGRETCALGLELEYGRIVIIGH